MASLFAQRRGAVRWPWAGVPALVKEAPTGAEVLETFYRRCLHSDPSTCVPVLGRPNSTSYSEVLGVPLEGVASLVKATQRSRVARLRSYVASMLACQALCDVQEMLHVTFCHRGCSSESVSFCVSFGFRALKQGRFPEGPVQHHKL